MGDFEVAISGGFWVATGAAKLVQVANSVAISGAGKPVSNVKGAALRVGYANVQAIATSVAMDSFWWRRRCSHS
jgi:hypothetical protein